MPVLVCYHNITLLTLTISICLPLLYINDIEANEDCILDTIGIHPYEEISDNYYRIYNNDMDNLNLVQDIYIYDDTMSISHNNELSDWNSGVTTYFIRQ